MNTSDMSTIPLQTVRTAADFAGCLDQLRVLAGPLSHREIESMSDRRLRRTKIGQVLGGQLPRRDFLAVYLEVCGVDNTEPWYRVWTRLISARGRRDDDALTLRNERDEALTTVARLNAQVDDLWSTVHATQTDRDAAVQRAKRAEAEAKRLRATEAEAQGRVRLLSQEVLAARGRITELDETVDGLRAELANAMTDIADLRWQLNSRAAANGSKRLTRYTQDEAEDLYGTSDILAPPPTIGER